MTGLSDNPEERDAQRRRLQWRCRRGMLELDLLLQRFVATACYDGLTAKQRRDFEELLELPDTLLLEYLMGRLVPTDGRYCDVVKAIRRASGP